MGEASTEVISEVQQADVEVTLAQAEAAIAEAGVRTAIAEERIAAAPEIVAAEIEPEETGEEEIGWLSEERFSDLESKQAESLTTLQNLAVKIVELQIAMIALPSLILTLLQKPEPIPATVPLIPPALTEAEAMQEPEKLPSGEEENPAPKIERKKKNLRLI